MPGPSKVIVLDPDPRAGRQVQLGFEREGVPAVLPKLPLEALAPDDEPALLLVGGVDGQALDLVRRARKLLDDTKTDIPLVCAGRGVTRRDAEAAGADEVVTRPAYLRDIVTIGRLLRGVPSGHREHLVGSLVETTGVYTLVRALSALGRSATLTLIRGLRRGEVRFYRGEVTSAQVGLIHGQAALHQLLLWTDARFDFAHEDIVRRHQIPLAPEELFADAERFLEGVRDSAGWLSPATVLEQDVQRVHNFGKQIPTEVHGVLRMFDGHRVLADVLEDSPYRVFETLRVAQKAVEAGLLKPVESQRPKSTWRAVLAIEEWLVGKDTRDAVVERTAQFDSGPVSGPVQAGTPKKRKKRKKRRASAPVIAPGSAKPDIDWGALVPRVIGAEVGPLSGVVPAMKTHGEIETATREEPREGLEALMDTDKRQRIFPTEIGLEPSVVVGSDEADGAAAKAREAQERERIRVDRVRREEADQAAAQMIAVPSATPPPADPARALEATPEDTTAPRERTKSTTDATDLVKGLVAEAIAPADSARALIAEPITVTETPTATVTVADTLTVVARADTAIVTATPTATIGEALDTAPFVKPAPPSEDEPSDGIVRGMIANADTARLARARRPPSAPLTDGPPVKETSGEIRPRRRANSAPVTKEPAILVSDLAAAHSAIAAVATQQAAAAPTSDAASSSRELAVSQIRADAVAMTDAEEAFFKRAESAPVQRTAPIESFDDLDEGYEPPKFWDRVFGRKRTKTKPPPTSR